MFAFWMGALVPLSHVTVFREWKSLKCNKISFHAAQLDTQSDGNEYLKE
jgi:hypothetical protein